MKKLFKIIFLLFLVQNLFSESEISSETEKIIRISIEDLPEIITPKQQSPKPKIQERTATNQEELEKIRIQNEEISAKNQKIQEENEIWKQYQKDLELYNKIKNYPKNFAKKTIEPKSLFYTYTVKKDPSKYLDTFNGLYARLQTKQGTLASINRISNSSDLKIDSKIILPVMQGLFIPEKPISTLEILLQKEFSSKIADDTPRYEIDGTIFYFLSEQNFSSTIISFFYDSGMKLPLSKKIVTSEFGYRVSPISGKWKLHAGIDLAAPIGTEVFACKNGIVTTVAYNEIYGNYIAIKHDGNKTSLYAHLSKTLVKTGEKVSTGQTIGLVGTTGASTGPHLHFEVRENGKAQNPGNFVKGL